MAVTAITDQTYYELTGWKIPDTSQLNLFNILSDHDTTMFMNIWRSFSLNESITSDIMYYSTYEVGSDAWWDNISQEIYGTPTLWWVLALVNDVVNPFEELEEGSNIKYLRGEYLYVLFKDIERLEGL